MGGTGRLYLGSRGSARSNERVCSKVRSQRLLKERSCEHQWGWYNLPWLRKPLECRAGEHIQSCKDTKDLCFKAFYLSGLIQTFWVFSYLLILMLGLLFCSVIKKNALGIEGLLVCWLHRKSGAASIQTSCQVKSHHSIQWGIEELDMFLLSPGLTHCLDLCQLREAGII